ncbi:unnamed protein product [Auanema sp. JU1783]|nr:unnamed protein product [Auanema sp. JU1783]
MSRRLLFSIFVFFGSALAQTPSTLCPKVDGAQWTFDHESTTCWLLGDRMLNFNQSQAYCQANGGNLASITNLDDFNIATSYSQPHLLPPWTGVYYSNLFWRNLDGSSTVKFYWQRGEPTMYGDCAVFRAPGDNNSGLASVPCNNLQYPLCKFVPTICPSTTMLGGVNGTFTSPNFPNGYYNNLNCRWLIRAPTNKSFISITFDPYQVDTPDDYVAIYEGDTISSSKRIDIFNDPSNQKNVFESEGPIMTVLFHSDSDTTDVGFSAKYQAIPDYPDIIQNGTSGNMSSPNYPKEYNNLVDQSYHMNGPSGTKIVATFNVFFTEYEYDVLYIYDGPIIDEQYLMLNISGLPKMPQSFESTKSSMSMVFMTDSSYTEQGWQMNWKAVQIV